MAAAANNHFQDFTLDTEYGEITLTVAEVTSEKIREQMARFTQIKNPAIAYDAAKRVVFLLKDHKVYSGGHDVPTTAIHDGHKVLIKVADYALLHLDSGKLSPAENFYQSYLDLLDPEIAPRLTLLQ